MLADLGGTADKIPHGGGGSKHCWEGLRLEQLAELLGGWRAGCLSPSLTKPRKAPSLLEGWEVAEAAQQEPSFSMPSAVHVCLQVLCSLKPPFWWLFLSLCCSFKKKESRSVWPYCRRMAGHLISTRREACATWEHPCWSRDWPSTTDGCLLGEKLTAQWMEPEKESKHPMINPQEQLY